MEKFLIPAARILFDDDDRKTILEEIDGILKSGQLTLGKYGERFEQEFLKWTGTKYAVAVSSGTCSLEIPLRSWGIGNGDGVIVPTNTFFASAAAVRHAGAEVQFVDHDPNTLAPSLAQIEEAVRPNTRVVMIVHIGGSITPEMQKIREFCDRKGYYLFEDAAHAHGSTVHGKFAGSFGHAASFSFYPTKIITSGEGGMIVTDDAKLAEDSRRYRDQGKESFLINKHTRLGNNWRLSEIHAVLGLSQLKKLPSFLSKRREAAAVLTEMLKDCQHLTPVTPPNGVQSNYYKYMAMLAPHLDRKVYKKTMKEKWGISFSGEVYEWPCHKQPIFESDPHCHGARFTQAEDFCARHVCLPVLSNLSTAEARYIAEAVLSQTQVA